MNLWPLGFQEIEPGGNIYLKWVLSQKEKQDQGLETKTCVVFLYREKGWKDRIEQLSESQLFFFLHFCFGWTPNSKWKYSALPYKGVLIHPKFSSHSISSPVAVSI